MSAERYVHQPELEAELEAESTSAEDGGHARRAALAVLGRRRQFLARLAGLSFLAGVAAALLLPPSFTATTEIMSPQPTPSSAGLLMNQMSSAAGQLALAAPGGLSLRNPNDVYIGLLNSRPVADAIIAQFHLRTVYHAKDMTAARKKLSARTTVLSEKSTFISVSVTDHDPNRAAAIANAYAEQLRVLTKTLALTEASHRRLFYEEQLKRARDDVSAAELAFRQIQQKKGLVSLDAQAKAMIGRLAALHAQVAEKQVQLEALRSYSTEQNPEVQLAEREVSSLSAQVAELEQRQQHTPSAGSAEGLQDVAGAGLDYLEAEHELQYRQILLDLLLKQYDVARLDEAKDAAIVQVVEPAIPPERRSSPSPVVLAAGITLLGTLGACGYVLLADFARRNPQLAASLTGFSFTVFSR